MKGKQVLLGTWAAGIILVSYRSFHSGKGMPAPKSLIAVNVLWTLLSFVSLASEGLAGVLSVGLIGGLLLTDSTILGGGTTTPTAPGASATAASGAIGNITSQTNVTNTPRPQGGQA
jgi:hypothetical protein